MASFSYCRRLVALVYMQRESGRSGRCGCFQTFIWTHVDKKSCLDRARNGLTRAASQIRTGNWRSAVRLHRMRRHLNNHCWLCSLGCKMTRSHVLLHCPNPNLMVAHLDAWGSKNPSGVRALLSNPRWELRLLVFLDRSGVGRVVAGGKDLGAAWADRRNR